MRKPIQISGNMVLCDDGSLFEIKKSPSDVWKRSEDGSMSYIEQNDSYAWKRLPAIPQIDYPEVFEEVITNEKETNQKAS